jgi:protein TonB
MAIRPPEMGDAPRLNGHARGRLTLPAALSVLAHATVLAVFVLLPARTEPPAAPAESSIAMVFAPAPADQPSAPDVASPSAETAPPAPAEPSDEPPPAEPIPPAVAPAPPEEPTPTPIEPPAPAPLAAEPPPPDVAQPVPEEPPPPAQKPPARHPAAHARSAPTTPHAGAAPSHEATPAEPQSAATGSANPSATAAIVPPRPVAGMETNRAPTYPEAARRRGEQGRVMLRVSVSPEGAPLDVEVMGTSGHPSLDSAALSAVRQWRFIPATQAGRSVAAVAEVPIRFRLSD